MGGELEVLPCFSAGSRVPKGEGIIVQTYRIGSNFLVSWPGALGRESRRSDILRYQPGKGKSGRLKRGRKTSGFLCAFV